MLRCTEQQLGSSCSHPDTSQAQGSQDGADELGADTGGGGHLGADLALAARAPRQGGRNGQQPDLSLFLSQN